MKQIPQIEQLQQWWNSLTFSQRRMGSVGGIALGIVLFYLLIWFPLVSSVSNRRDEVIAEQQLVLEMQQSKADILYLRSLNTQVQGSSNLPLLTIIDQTLRDQQVNGQLTQIQEASDNKVKLAFSTVTYDELISWLESLASQYGIQVEQIHITATNTTGVVQADLVLSK